MSRPWGENQKIKKEQLTRYLAGQTERKNGAREPEPLPAVKVRKAENSKTGRFRSEALKSLEW